MKVTQDNNIEEFIDLTLWSVIGNIGIGRYCFRWSVIGPKNPDRSISSKNKLSAPSLKDLG